MPRPVANMQAEVAALEAVMQAQPIGSVSEDGVTMTLPMWNVMTKRLDELYQQIDRANDIAGGTNSRFQDRQVTGTGRTSPANNNGQWMWPA